ncbi:MAG TPA: GDSL-type esterase/lipase family protein [Kineosporiaceae bacterium]|nr:GDSL-type esterase/lipase family protein [Kineosporiaceae bacterium]
MPVNRADHRRISPRLALIATAAALIAGLAGPPSAAATPANSPTNSTSEAAAGARWTGAWASGQQGLVDAGPFTDTTLRLLVSPTQSGSVLRIRLANTFGSHALKIDGASVAVVTTIGQPALVPGSSRALRFRGRSQVTLDQGARVRSDAIQLPFRYGQTLAVDLYLADSGAGPVTGHAGAGQSSFSATGDHRSEVSGTSFTGTLSSWFYLDGVDVQSVQPATPHGAVVALGDSITDGAYAAWNGNRRWPDVLAARLQQLPPAQRRGVLNQGIGGNRVLAYRGDCCGTSESAIDRLERDVLTQTGVRTLIIADGINDLGYHSTAPELIAGLTTLTTRAKHAGLHVVIATVTPYGCDSGCFGPDQEADRQLVNTWIRTSSVPDAVADFDAAVADPQQPDRLAAVFDAGDHLHLNDTGYAALGNAVDLRSLA